MEKQYEKRITWTIKKFPSLGSEEYSSDQFVVGGDSKWRLVAYPKGNGDSINKCLSLFLEVADSESLPCGWKRHTKFRLTVVNQISEKLSQLKVLRHWFDHKSFSWGTSAMLPLTKLDDKNGGFLVNGEVKIVAEVRLLEVVGKSDILEETLLVDGFQVPHSQQYLRHPSWGFPGRLPLSELNDISGGFLVNGEAKIVAEVGESIHVNGFQVLPSQVESVKSLFKEQPDFASKFHTKNPLIRTTYLNVLLSLTKILSQSPKELSDDDLANAYSTLTYVKKAGFKLDWLEKKLKEVGKTRVLEVEQELKNKKQKCAEMDDLLEFLK